MLLFVLLSGLITFCHQTETTISGKIIDSETNLPLPFCKIIKTPNQTQGTISNIQGDFIFNALSLSDTLEISQIGYQSVKLAVHDIADTVYLKPKIYEMDAVIVRPLDFKTFIPKVKENISKSFVENYPVVEGIFRKQVVENHNYVFMGECALAVCNSKPYANDSKFSVLQSMVTVNEANLTGIRINIKQTLNSNLLLYPYFYIFDKSLTDNVIWKLKEVRMTDDGMSDIYILSYECFSAGQSKEHGVVYVRADDYGILRIDMEAIEPDQTVRDFVIGTVKCIATFQYQKMPNSGKYILHYSRFESHLSFSRGDAKNDYTMTTDFLVTNFRSERKGIRIRTNIDPFELHNNNTIVEKSDLRVIPRDYE